MASGATRGTRDDRVELLHGWGGSGGETRILKEIFEDRHPDRTVELTLEENVSLETKRRFLTRDPPDVWVEWPGTNLEPYQRVGVLGDVSDVWTTTDMERTFHDAAREAVRLEGAYRGVPLNVNRVNLLFFNRHLVERAGVDPGRVRDSEEFVEVLETVDDALDVDALVMAFLQPFASEGLQLWETLFLGQYGPEAYRDLIEGEATAHRSEIRDALAMLHRLFEFANDDAVNLLTDHEGERFVDGQAAFRIQGIWGARDHPADFEYGVDWDHVPFPGTEDASLINMDALVYPDEPRHPEPAKDFLEAVGSASGIERWCESKRAIPPRSDVSVEDEFTREQVRRFEASRHQVPSIAHGLAVEPEVLVDLEVPFSTFTTERDVEATTEELVSVFESI